MSAAMPQLHLGSISHALTEAAMLGKHLCYPKVAKSLHSGCTEVAWMQPISSIKLIFE